MGFFMAEKQGFVFQRSVKTMFWKRSVQLAVTGFGNVVAPCIARKSRKTTSKNPTYSDRVFVAEKQGFEPWLRFTRTTPLAGEPLRPLGYFSKNRRFTPK